MGRQFSVGHGIGKGGMGEIFLAVKEGIGGFQRLVVIKRLLPKLEQQQRTRDMFLSEARLAAALHHPNVVQILDVGRDEVGHFMAMEYLSGENLLMLLKTLHTRVERIPVEIACEIGASVAAGLHCAHTATDGAGNPKPIIHRDITPANLIVCYNGAVKIVDFGIAKVTDVDDRTVPGTIKGKYAYLAPEQVEGNPIDVRTDVFQLGIVMHEMLTGRRLFKGQTEHQTMTAVLSRPIAPPSADNPEVPRELDDLVLWMLRRPREERPHSADEVSRALSAWVKKSGRTVTQDDVGDWMKTTFDDLHDARLSMERACYARAGSAADGIVEVPYIEPTAEYSSTSGERVSPAPPPQLGAGSQSGSHSQHSQHSLSMSGSSSHYHGTLAPERPTTDPAAALLARPPRRKAGLIVLLLLLIGGTASAIALSGNDEPSGGAAKSQQRAAAPDPTPAPEPAPIDATAVVSIPPVQVDLTISPDTARIELDGAGVGIGSFRGEVDPGQEHELRVSADGYAPQVVTFVDAPPTRIELETAVDDGVDDDAHVARKKKRTRTAQSKRQTKSKTRAKPAGDTVTNTATKADTAVKVAPPAPPKKRRKKLSDNKNPWANE